MSPERKARRRVLIDERTEWDELGPMALGRFDATAFNAGERPSGHVEDLSLEDALAWSRDRGEIVEVRLSGWGENLYSAGAEASGAPSLADVPPITRRRPSGWEFLDRTEADEPIEWDVVVSAALAHAASQDTAERFPEAARAAAVEAGHEVLWALRVTQTPTYGAGGGWTRYVYEQVLVVRLQARTAAQAVTLADNLARTSLSATGIALNDRVEPFQTAPFATGSRAAQANVKL